MNDGQMPEDETAFAKEEEKQVNKQKVNQSRRKFTRAGLIGVPAILTLTSKPVLAVNNCTFSGNLSGNMSDARVNDPCEGDLIKGFRPVHWLDEITSGNWSDTQPISVGLIDITPDTLFVNTDLFANPNAANVDATTTFGIVLSLYDDGSATDADRLAAQTAAALLNAATGYPNYVYSTAEVLTLYNTYHNDPPNDGILLQAFENLNTVS